MEFDAATQKVIRSVARKKLIAPDPVLGPPIPVEPWIGDAHAAIRKVFGIDESGESRKNGKTWAAFGGDFVAVIADGRWMLTINAEIPAAATLTELEGEMHDGDFKAVMAVDRLMDGKLSPIIEDA